MVADPATRRLVGQLVPARPATVELEGTDGKLGQEVDRFGRFTFDAVPAGPVRISVTAPDGSAIATDWVAALTGSPLRWCQCPECALTQIGPEQL